MKNKKFLDRLVRNRFRSKNDVRKLIDQHKNSQQRRQRSRRPAYLTGVHNGNFYRIKVPPKQNILPNLSPLPPPQTAIAPKAFKNVEHAIASTQSQQKADQQGGKREAFQEVWSRLKEWWKENWSILVLNFGSCCTLLGFTRSDVLELRSLSVVGSLSSVVYLSTHSPFRRLPVMWALTFAGVNAWKIAGILNERNSTVRLTRNQEDVYIKFFMPHGITPKQFERIDDRAKIVHFKKESIIIKQGQKQEYVYLIVRGNTRASILGRRLSAVSATTPSEHEEQREAGAGAWIGELAFLEQYWIKEQDKVKPRKKTHPQGNKQKAASTPAVEQKEVAKEATAEARAEKAAEVTREKNGQDAPSTEEDQEKEIAKRKWKLLARRTFRVVEQPPPKLRVSRSLYTIVAADDCTAMRWSHADMEELMEVSTDMRAAMTRAMTAAIVGKVINFTVSKKKDAPTWSTWLDDWKSSDADRIKVSEVVDESENVQVEDEKLPTYPIKKFA